jgi:hypothetical protein
MSYSSAFKQNIKELSLIFASVYRCQTYYDGHMQSTYLHFENPKIYLEVYLFVEFVSELQFKT